jgi:hypothetical protein
VSTRTLFRPVGTKEYALIAQSGFTAFPPRLPGQPIFYPVLDEDYAHQIARDWNVKESGAGYVTAFDVDVAVADRYVAQQVGARNHVELWVPAEDLAEFNAAIVPPIRIIAKYHTENH